MGSSHHSMTHPQVADEGDSPQMWRVLQIYWISSCEQLAKGGPPAWWLGKALTTPHIKSSLLQNVTHGLRYGHILWNNLDNGKWLWDLEGGMLGVSSGQVCWKQQVNCQCIN